MSIKFEDYGFNPKWLKLPGIVSESKTPTSIKYEKRCSHCNHILEVGESHTPVNDLKVPSMCGVNKIKQCLSMRG